MKTRSYIRYLFEGPLPRTGLQLLYCSYGAKRAIIIIHKRRGFVRLAAQGGNGHVRALAKAELATEVSWFRPQSTRTPLLCSARSSPDIAAYEKC